MNSTKHLYLFLLFLALCFNSESACKDWLTAFESRWTHSPEWHYAGPAQLRDGRWYVEITPSALPKLTEAEKAAMVELSESELPDPPPMP